MRGFVQQLRAKLGEDGARPACLFDERGVGYRFPVDARWVTYAIPLGEKPDDDTGQMISSRRGALLTMPDAS